ncbi:MAG: phage tail sheath family protein [Burkholderiales bacterium]|nr:phage tail sheath family protein [Burkholderiales bacterium]
MPAALSYPGVYIEELPSGVRTITGVATSITAFVGRALRGPVDDPLRIYSFADFERNFGGLWADSTMSYAVNQYFQNGGSDAIIVRLHNGALTGSAGVALSAGGPAVFTAAYPGGWAARVRIRIDLDLDPDVVAANPANTMFNLSVKDLAAGTIEQHRNLSISATHPRFATAVLKQASQLLRGPATIAAQPTASGAPAATATDPFDDPSATAMTVGANPDGSAITATQLHSGVNLRANKQGLYQLEKADLFNLLVIAPYTADTDLAKADWDAVVSYAHDRRAMVLVDAPSSWANASAATTAGAIVGVASRNENAAMFFPRLQFSNPLHDNRIEPFAPSGAVAGVMARTDANRGVWKSPAGMDATLSGVQSLSVNLNDPENGALNQLGVNCVRNFPNTGPTVWGARTLKGADSIASEWKYLAVRRMALFLEESLYRGMQWVVFEPNDEPLWAQIRLNIGAFMQTLFRQGAFQGASPKDAYFVRCDGTTTTQTDINLGIVNVIVGFAPLKPAEFVVIKLQQIAGDIPT